LNTTDLEELTVVLAVIWWFNLKKINDVEVKEQC